MTAPSEIPFFVMFVELETARRNIAAACPGINRIFEHANRRAELMKGSVATYQVAAVCKPVRETSRTREQQQPCRLNRAAGKDENIRLLLDEVSRGILVDCAFAAPALVYCNFMHVAVRPQIVAARLQRVRNKD